MAQHRLVPVYCIDTGPLINLKWYPQNIKLFTPIWDKVNQMIGGGELISHIEVYNEILKGQDEILKWCKKNKNMFKDVEDVKVVYAKKQELMKEL